MSTMAHTENLITREIPIADILSPEFNSRTARSGDAGKEQQQRLEELTASMKLDGQRTAIEVEGPVTKSDNPDEVGKYRYVAGWRRITAAKRLNWTMIRADIRPETTLADRILENIKENLEREDLTPYEQARSLMALRESGMTTVDAGKKLHMTGPQVSNLVAGFKNPPEIINAWAASHPAATQEFIRDLARDKVEGPDGKLAKTPEQKIAAFDARAKEIQAAKDAGKKRAPAAKKASSTSSGYSVSQKRLEQAINFVKSKKTPAFKWDKDDAKILLDWIVKGRETAPDNLQKHINDVEAALKAEAA